MSDHIADLMTRMRESLRRSEEESATWQQRKAYLNRRHGQGTPEARMACKGDLIMKDAFSGCEFHSGMAQTYASVAVAEIAAQQYFLEKARAAEN